MPVSFNFGFTPVSKRNPIGQNIAAYADAIKTIDSKYTKAIETQSAIDAAIGQLPLNEAEDAYRTKLRDEVIGAIESTSDPIAKFEIATKMAGSMMSRPDLIGRIRAQAKYDNFVKQTQARKDLTEDDKAWAIATNPYQYTDKLDSTGRVVGGSSPEYATGPVGQIDFNKILATAKQLVFQETQGGTEIVWHDAAGNPITDAKDFDKISGVMYTKNNTRQGINGDKLKDIIESAIDNEPGARARIDQDWKVANWKYSQMTSEEQAANLPSELFADNGKKYTKQEWYNNRFNRPISAMSGMNYSTTIKIDENYNKWLETKNMLSAYGGNGQTSYGNDVTATTLSVPTTIDSSEVINKALGSSVNTVTEFEKTFPELRKDAAWKAARASNDFNAMADIISKNDNIMNGEYGNQIRPLLRELRSDASIVNSVLANSKERADILMVNAAFQTGSELPANEVGQKITNLYNRIVGNNSHKLRYEFKNVEEANDFKRRLNTNSTTKEIDGKIVLEFPTNDPINYRGLKLYHDFEYDDRGIFRSSTDIISLDENGNKIKSLFDKETIKSDNGLYSSYTYGIPQTYSPYKTYCNELNKVTSSATNKLDELRTGQIVVETKTSPIPLVMEAQADFGRNGNGSAYEAKEKAAYNIAISTLAGIHGSQYEVEIFDDKTHTESDANIKDKTSLVAAAATYFINHPEQAKYLIKACYRGNKVGYEVKVPTIWDKSKNKYVEGDIEPTTIRIYGLDDPQLRKLQSDSKYQANAQYEKLSLIPGATQIGFDNTAVTFNNYGMPYYTDGNGNTTEIDRTIATNHLDRFIAYEQIRPYITGDDKENYTKTGKIRDNIARAVARFVQEAYDAAPNTPEFNQRYAQIINQLMTE